jgi:hypothetical protein
MKLCPMLLYQNNIKYEFSVAGKWPYNLDIFTGEVSFQLLTDHPCQRNNHDTKVRFVNFYKTDILESAVSCHHEAGSSVGPSSSEQCKHYASFSNSGHSQN